MYFLHFESVGELIMSLSLEKTTEHKETFNYEINFLYGLAFKAVGLESENIQGYITVNYYYLCLS